MRKSVHLFLAAVLLALPICAEGMSLDEVLAAHFEALGGAERLQSVQSARFTGTMTMGPSGEVPFTITFKRPQKARMEFTMQGMTGIQAYDGETAWMVMPFMGKSDPEIMVDDQAKNMKEQADLDGPLMNWQEKGHQVELMGVEDVEGTEAYKVKVTLANGDVRYHYLDSEYFITIKQAGTTSIQGNEVEFETTLSDYKEVDGLMFPHSIENRAKGAPEGQVITFETIELGIEVPDDQFIMPEVSGQNEAAEQG